MMSNQSHQKTRNLLIQSGMVDLALGLLKIVVGWFANSHALIADGIHSFSDLATDIMVWFLNRLGTEAPDEDHPYGHARFETLGALILGTVLILVAVALVYDSVLRLIDIESIVTPTWPALVAAVISIAAKEWLYQITRKMGEKIKSNLLLANAWHHRSDALSSIIVLVGVGGAILGITWLEMVAAMGVAFMIALIGWKLVKESVEELVDTALSENYVADIQETIVKADGVRGVHSLRTRRMGSAVILDIHLQVDPAISVSEGHHIGDWVSQQLESKFQEISDITVHIDAEDDAEGTTTVMPPLRNEVRTELLAAWQDYLREQDIQKLTLHYLDNVINVEIFLRENPATGKEKLQADLIGASRSLRWLGEILIWYK
ncbi:MAG: cation diffusion facilitator family transporter [Gammaproteobacteria bacterium]|nr:cation diffusion facilitator family transporter [Gammaproteobacteria bacterium]